MFKLGDKVKRKDGTTFSNGATEVTVSKVDRTCVWFVETGTWTSTDNVVVVDKPHIAVINTKISQLESEIKEKQAVIDALKLAIELTR